MPELRQFRHPFKHRSTVGEKFVEINGVCCFCNSANPCTGSVGFGSFGGIGDLELNTCFSPTVCGLERLGAIMFASTCPGECCHVRNWMVH
jgi:hypothetical protein